MMYGQIFCTVQTSRQQHDPEKHPEDQSRKQSFPFDAYVFHEGPRLVVSCLVTLYKYIEPNIRSSVFPHEFPEFSLTKNGISVTYFRKQTIFLEISKVWPQG